MLGGGVSFHKFMIKNVIMENVPYIIPELSHYFVFWVTFVRAGFNLVTHLYSKLSYLHSF